jgi:hypothetical protein
MVWKTILDSTEIKIYEDENSDMKIRVEAREENKHEWRVIKKFFKDNSQYVQEFKVLKTDLSEMLSKIMAEKSQKPHLNYSRKVSSKKKSPKVKVFREYKDVETEKWSLVIDGEKYVNSVIIHYDDYVTLDLILHSKYKDFENSIIEEICSVFNFSDDDLEYNIFYYCEYNRYLQPSEFLQEDEFYDEED